MVWACLEKKNSGAPDNAAVVDSLTLFGLILRPQWCIGGYKKGLVLKVAFIEKVLMHLRFPQTDELYYFSELEI